MERLISFALDLDTRVQVDSHSPPAELAGSHISGSILFIYTLYRLETSYHLHSRGGRDRRILVEHPIRSDWKLVEPQAPENQTASYYRFLVELESASAQAEIEENLRVSEERKVEQQLSLTGTSDAQIQSYLNRPEISQDVKDALRGLLDRRSELNDTVRRINDEERKRSQIHREQERIRENMTRLDKESELFQRYVDELDDQEDQLAVISRTIEELTSKERMLRQRLLEYIQSLEVE